MQKLGMSLILGMTALLAGCSSSSNSGSGSSNNGTGTSTQSGSSLTITTTSLPGGTVGAAYSAAVLASGGATPYTYSASGLPGGLSISSNTGAITGTPAQSSIGTSSATIKVTDSTQPTSQSATTSLNIKISPAHPCGYHHLTSRGHCRIALSINDAPGLRRRTTLYMGTSLR